MLKTDKKDKFKIRQKYTKKQIILILVIIACLTSLVVIFGRYVTNSINNFFLRSEKFYFESDQLSEEGTTYQVDSWDGVSDYTIVINLNTIKNNLEYIDYDLKYKLNYTVTDNAICQLSKQEGIIYSSTNSDTFTIMVTPNIGLKNGDKVTVEVEAIADAEYQKTLKGTFTLVVGQEDTTYEIEDSKESPYMELNITNTQSYYLIDTPFGSYSIGDRIDVDTYINLPDTDKQKCHSAIVEMSFDPNEIVLDLTNNEYLNAENISTTTINGYTYINYLTIRVDALSSTSLRFYKNDISKDYTYPNISDDSVVEVSIN